MNIELIYDADCPNVAQTRSVLNEALSVSGVSVRWREWERSSADCPEYARVYGSPTILMDGVDVVSTAAVSGTGACRVYSDARGKLGRAPALDVVYGDMRRQQRQCAHKRAPNAHWLKFRIFT